MSQTIEYVIYGVQAEKDWKDWVTLALTAMPAFIALWFTWSQNNATKKHNRLSVTPHLDSMTHTTLLENSYIYKYSITNNGVGPAILVEAKITIDGVEIDTDETLPDAVRKLLAGIRDDQFSHQSVAIGSFISPGTTIEIVSITCASKEILEQVKNKARLRAHIFLRYKSIYGEEKTFDSMHN
ncbi:hypothetical protein ABDX87_20050 [Pseudomonas abietaniphila]|uniref:hypothetical protein n=1 Tax=Pseudomonas abietaniphila TaxID=89065 RepID=UPI003217AA40